MATDEPTASGTPAPPPVVQPRPAPGVYSYAVAGGESLDMFGAEREYPDRATATVTLGTGCAWRWRAALVEEHVDETALCTTTDGEAFEELFSQSIEFMNVTEERVLVCDPPVLVGGPSIAAGETSAGRAATRTTT